MKRIHKFTIFIVTLLTSFSLLSCNDDTKEPENQVSYEELPSAAKSFLHSYFYGYDIISVSKETVDDLILFEVNIQDGFEAEFNGDGEWLQVQAPENTSIPNINFIPEVIRQALSYSYSGYGIQQVNKTGEGYKIKLVTGLNIYSNMSGELTPEDENF